MDFKLNSSIIKFIAALVVIVIIGFLFAAPYLENKSIEEQISIIKSINNQHDVASIMKSDDFENLPYLIKQYLQKAINNKSKSPKICTINYFGKTRETPNSEWIEVNAKLNLSTISPAFVNVLESKPFNLLWETTTEIYTNGIASTETKFISAIPQNSFVGNKLNRSYLVLYLMESIFSPTSMLPNINTKWRQINNNSVEATIWEKDVKVSAIFHFNEKGKISKITSENRFMPGKIDYTKEDFTMYLANYKDVGDYLIPTYFEFQWNLANNNFTFGRFQIKDALYE